MLFISDLTHSWPTVLDISDRYQVAGVLENNEDWGCCQDGRQVISLKHPCHTFTENVFRLADFRRKITEFAQKKDC